MGDSANTKPPGDSKSASQDERDEYDPPKIPQYGVPQSDVPQANYPYNQYVPQHPLHARQEPFNMNALGSTLPAYPDYRTATPSTYPSGSSPSALAYQLHNVQYAGSTMAQSGANSPYTLAYSPQFQAQYPPSHTPSPQSLQPGVNTGGQFYNNPGFVGQTHHQPAQHFFMQSNQFLAQSPVYSGMPGSGQFGGRGTFLGGPRAQVQQRGSEYTGAAHSFGAPGRSSSIASSTGPSSVVRGPPRKPRQSGHAVWIGNLPPQTDLMSLVLHVCKETTGLESLFLISKSNCAFANFKDEITCVDAQSNIHDSRFQTVRLVSRLRRGSIGTTIGVSVPMGPAALTPPSNPVVARSPSPEDELKAKGMSGEAEKAQGTEDASSPKDKFFIVKSLTVEDLELSVRNGIWATQSHNEDALNKAYQSADNVYLIFSANKSGEYFGYARMVSPINDDPAAAIEFAPKAQTIEDPELPKAIPTPATEFTPKGRIIDDSARGTIFWEAERDESDGVDGADEVEEGNESPGDRSDQDESPPPSKAWGKPFQIEWVSTTRLPFYRTRGLRNPWNSNREVKIARDGTELETAIGRRLLGLFHRLPSPVAPQHIPGVPVQVLGGYPQIRPFQ